MVITMIFVISLSSSLSVYDTKEYNKLHITSAPKVFGYSEDKGNELFPEFIYPNCPRKKSYGLYIDYSKNKFYYNCTQKEGFIIVGPETKITITNPPYTKFFVSKYSLDEEVKIFNYNDFSLGWCGKNKGDDATDYFLSPRMRRASYKAALEKSSLKKPLIILFITPDSLSRNHFFRKLKTTVSYLSSLKNYQVYDYKFHNIIGADTSENQMRVFGEKWVKSFEGDQNIDYHGPKAIWKILKNLGFVTLWGTDACADNVPKSMGRVPEVDNVVNLFFCSQYVFGKYRGAKQLLYKQRCLGSKMPHSYLMEYSLNFTKMYPKANQWIYNHFTAAHEGSGQHAQTLDLDLTNYIKKYLTEFKETHEVAIFLCSDHGMRYGDYMSDSASIQEHRLPACFTIISDNLIRSQHFDKKTMEANSFRLTTKPDLRKTMIELASNYTGNYVSSEHLQRSYYNFLKTPIPDNRTCEDANIPIWFCASFTPKNIEKYIFSGKENLTQEEIALKKMIDEIINRAIEYINENSYQNYYGIGSFLCEKVSLKMINSVNFVEISSTSYVIRIIFDIFEDEKANFDSWVEISKKSGDPLIFLGEKMFTKVIYVGRIDKAKITCENDAREMGIDPNLCICKENQSLIS
ncbi:hypothetical protein SteCoe_26794 [Stentor coeruleus]|uniref:Sulfatase N-terminal domain-containing protein n=1 Tax=Stentor coeruleus TaxID=5963 RepID=A0A1R2BC18_9CILI|nr:hypothetical protein SteCoe_26794 [Stentor coeruleus]